MKKSTVLVLFALQFVLFATISGGIYFFSKNNLAEANARAEAAQSLAIATEQRATALTEQLNTVNQLNDDQKKQIEQAKTQTATLQEEVAKLKAAPKSTTTVVATPSVQNGITFGRGGIQLGAELAPEMLKQLGNLQFQANGNGVTGTITVNGETIQLGDTKKIEEHAIRIILNELEHADEQLRPAEKKVEKVEKAEKNDEKF